MGFTIKIPARRPPTLSQKKRKLCEDLKARPSKRPRLTSPFHPHDSTDQSDANANRDSSLPPTRRKTHTRPDSHSDHPRSEPPSTPQQGPTTTEGADRAHRDIHPSPPSKSERTFKEFVESTMGEEFVTFPLELSRLEFARVPLALGGTQTLSIEADEGLRVRDEEGRAEEEVMVRERGSTGDEEKVGGDLARANKRATTEATNNGCVKETVVETRRVTRSMTPKMALDKGGNQVENVGGMSREKNTTTGSNATKMSGAIEAKSIKANVGDRVADAQRIHCEYDKGCTQPPPLVTRLGGAPPPQPTFPKCRTPFASVPVHLRNGLPFTTPTELTTFLHTEPPSKVSQFIESVRERHLWTFALRHGRVLPTDPRLPIDDFQPPPPPSVAKINALRVRLENLNVFIEQLRTSQNDIPFAEWEFLYLERARLEVEIEGLGLEWYRLLAKYVGEYDELVFWLRLQASVDTSGARTVEEVKAVLTGEVGAIKVKREEDIRAAVDRFVGWADAQYDAMRREEVTLRWWALRMLFAKKGAYREEPSKRPYEKGEEGEEVALQEGNLSRESEWTI